MKMKIITFLKSILGIHSPSKEWWMAMQEAREKNGKTYK